MRQQKRDIAKTVGYSFMSVALAAATFAPAVAIATESGEAVIPSDDQGKSREGAAATTVRTPSSKDETVYVHTNADGSVKSEEVTATLSNPGGASELADSTTLSDIEVKDGDGVYSGPADDMVWQADGGDVTYKGTTDAEAPIEVGVTYTLDGREVAPADMAGKSGHVTVRYDYANKSKAVVEVNGAPQEVYTPFVAVTAVLLDDDVFSNVSATNGRVVQDGDRTIVVGYAMPGLGESLDLSDDDASIPSYFEFEADAIDFELKSALTMASPNLFDDLDLDFDTAGLSDAAGSLRSAMSQVVSASGEFADAVGQVSDAARLVSDGAGELSGQASALPASASQLSQGAQAVSTGVARMHEAAKALDQGLLAIIGGPRSSGADQPGLADAAASVSQLEQQAEELYEVLGGAGASGSSLSGQSVQDARQLSALAAQVSDEAAAFSANARNVQDQAAQAASSASQAVSDIASAQAAVQSVDLSAITDPAARAQVQAQLDAANASLAAAGSSAQGASAAAQGVRDAAYATDTSAADQAVGAFAAASGGDRALSAQSAGDADAEDLAKRALALYKGLEALDAGLDQAVQGLSALEQQALAQGMLSQSAFPELASGAQQVARGAATLARQAPALVGGMDQVAGGTQGVASAMDALVQGAHQLVSGLQQFNDQGISQLASSIDEQLVRPLNRFDAVTQAGRDYRNFSGITAGTNGSVKFVFETDPIQK